ncbi:hypothetical protein O0L34_g13321 [Tuta absoluta]|nr:hypothetical protein O0L34_g13321 [Tuta absoluta]
MALRHDSNMESNFLPADPPPLTDINYETKQDLASEYFNTFNQICENYRPEAEIRASDSLRLTSEILDGVREYSTDLEKDRLSEYVNTDFTDKVFKENVFSFGQPDASALLRHRARRRYNEEHGIPPGVTSQESGYGSDEFGHDSPSRYASPKSGGAPAQYQEPYYSGEWGAQYYQPVAAAAAAPNYHQVYQSSPGIAGAGSSAGEAGGGAELPLPPMSSFRAAAPLHSPPEPTILVKPPLQPMYSGGASGAASTPAGPALAEGSVSSYGSSPATPVHSPPPHARLYPLKHSPHHHNIHNTQVRDSRLQRVLALSSYDSVSPALANSVSSNESSLVTPVHSPPPHARLYPLKHSPHHHNIHNTQVRDSRLQRVLALSSYDSVSPALADSVSSRILAGDAGAQSTAARAPLPPQTQPAPPQHTQHAGA